MASKNYYSHPAQRCIKDYNHELFKHVDRRPGLMASALVSRASGPGLSPGQGHCVVFLGKTLYSHSASLRPGVQMGISGFNAGR